MARHAPPIAPRALLALLAPLASACPAGGTGATTEAPATSSTSDATSSGGATVPTTSASTGTEPGTTTIETGTPTTTAAASTSTGSTGEPSTGELTTTGTTEVGTTGGGTTEVGTTGGSTTGGGTTDGSTTGQGFCGDGVVDPGEQCDDGNAEAGDGCEPACTWTPCAFLWQTSYPEPGISRHGQAVAVDSKGDIAIGAIHKPGQADSRMIALKLDPNGALLWTGQASDLRAEAHDVVMTADGSVLVVGVEYEVFSNDLTRRFTPGGSPDWLAYKVLATPSDGYGIAFAPGGGAIVAGYRTVNSVPIAWLARLDVASGAVEWTSVGQPPGATHSAHLGVTVDPQGDIYTTGNIRIDGTTRLMVRRFDPMGVQKWKAEVPSPAGFARGWDLALVPGGVAVVGEFFYGNAGKTGGDLWVGVFDGAGALQWSDLHDSGPGQSYDRADGVAVDPEGRIHVVGQVQPGPLYRGVYRKYESDGTLLCSEVVDATPDKHTMFFGVAIDPAGFPVLTGYTGTSIFAAKMTP